MPVKLGATSYLSMYDAAYPPAVPPVTDVVAVYIGGDTPHVWTDTEISVQKSRYALPVFVRSDPPGPGAAADVAAAVQRLREIGITGRYLVAWDSETSVDPSYIADVSRGLLAAGYVMIEYGSLSAVTGNKNPDGWYWDAYWTGQPHLDSGDEATQYANKGAYDLSLVNATLESYLWPLHPAPKPPPAPPGASFTVHLPVLAQGSTDKAGSPFFVHRAQALTAVIGADNNIASAASVKADGDYGPLTAAGIRALQWHWKIPQTGITDGTTWSYLIQGGSA